MPRNQADYTPAIEGNFLRTQSKRSVARGLFVILIAGAFLAASATLLPPIFVVPIAVIVAALVWLFVVGKRRRRVRVRLDKAILTVSGDGYDIRLSAPFRCKTGVERRSPTDRDQETCFIRMVIDVHGKPLVFEEQVQAGDIPPPLDEIVGISSALGMAELTSLTPYPGTLWALIEQMRIYEQSSQRAESDETIRSLSYMGERQLSNKQYIEAIDTYSTIIRQAPDTAAAYFGRGSARYFARRDLDRAVNDLTTTLRLDPRRSQVYRMRALVRAALEDWTSLRDDCSAALQHLAQTAELYNLRGTASFRLGDFEGAMADFESAIKLEPGRPESYYNRGLARQQTGRRREALADFEHALRLNPEFEPAKRSLDAIQGWTAQPIKRSQ